MSDESGLTIRGLEKAFHKYLDQTPPILKLPLPTKEEKYLIYDGLWFGKKLCLLSYRIYQDPLIIYASIRKSERSSQIATDLQVIKTLGYQIDGVVIDGGKGLVNGKRLVFPNSPLQICLAHVQRQALIGLGRYPKDYRLHRLRSLTDHLFLIESKEALAWWLGEVKTWMRIHRDYLNETTHDSMTHKWWYKHRNARKTLKVLIQASKTSFTFLSYPLMPKTTNGIEGIFSNIRMKWLIHRGLKRSRWPNYLMWFIYFRNKQILADRKKHHV